MNNAIFSYLTDLSLNNNREWYHANKARLRAANAEFERLIGEFIAAIGEFDSSVIHNAPQDLTFKLVRDTRFSHDKSPYNPTFRAHIAPAGKQPIPVGYYISLAPGRSFLGGGLFAAMFKDATAIVRDYIAANGDEFAAIARDLTVKGEALKNVPTEYDPAHPQAEFLKYKSWYLEHFISDELVLSDDFISEAASTFRAMKPFNDYLNTALAGFQMPGR